MLIGHWPLRVQRDSQLLAKYDAVAIYVGTHCIIVRAIAQFH